MRRVKRGTKHSSIFAVLLHQRIHPFGLQIIERAEPARLAIATPHNTDALPLLERSANQSSILIKRIGFLNGHEEAALRGDARVFHLPDAAATARFVITPMRWLRYSAEA